MKYLGFLISCAVFALACPALAQDQEAGPPAAGSDPSASPAPPPETPVPGSRPWEDPEEKLAATSTGAVDACETVAFPLTFLPGVGSVASSLIEWVCLVPAAFAIDYVAVHHAGYESFLWQPLAALLLAKLYRGIVLVAGISAIVASAVLYTTVVSGTLLALNAGYYIPVGLTGVLTLIGGMVLAMRFAEKRGSELIFTATYTNLANELSSPAEASRAQEEAWIKPPPGFFGRSLALLAAAAGAEPESSWSYGIPVVGPILRAPAKAAAVEEATLQVGRDVLGENPQHPETLHTAAVIASYTEGALGAGGQALLALGGAIFVTGTIIAGLAYQSNEDLAEYSVWLGGLGGLGVIVAGGGVVLILARQIPRVARSLIVPASFGLWPPDDEQAVE